MTVRQNGLCHALVSQSEWMAVQTLVFLKVPALGQGKSRLASTLGPEAALNVAKFLLERTLATCVPLPNVRLCYTPSTEGESVYRWIQAGWSTRPQVDGILGQRLFQAFKEAFDEGALGVQVIGTDCPDLTTNDLLEAERMLGQCDVVIGPARDGGYWLLGMRRFIPELFADIPWSTNRVLALTLQRARDLSLRVHLLRTLNDIDTEADWWSFLESESRLLPS